MDCTYCILQAYLNNPYQNFFINDTDLFRELDEETTAQKGFLRIGTGEFTDSMALDRITGMSRKLISFFAERDNCMLELKTKSAFIDNLKEHRSLRQNHYGVVSEQRTDRRRGGNQGSAIDERLAAASACASMGYPLAFHFDPIIIYPGLGAGV